MKNCKQKSQPNMFPRFLEQRKTMEKYQASRKRASLWNAFVKQRRRNSYFFFVVMFSFCLCMKG